MLLKKSVVITGIVFFSLLFLSDNVMASSNISLVMPAVAGHDFCSGNTTISQKFNYTITTDYGIDNITIERNEDCPFGCDNVTNSCSPSPLNASLIVAGIIFLMLIVVGIIIYLYKRSGL